MKSSYIIRYSWRDLFHVSNRPFSLINIVAICVSTAAFVVLLGGILAFQHNGNQMIDQLGLRIEVSGQEGNAISQEQRQEIAELEGVQSVHWWSPTLFVFYNREGRLYDGLGGRTIEPGDPILNNLKDIRGEKKIQFLAGKKIPNTPFDEIGIIVPFSLLKRLSYVAADSSPEQPDTWPKQFPSTLKIRIKAGKGALDIALPIVGIVPNFEQGRYLITEDCYRLLGINWQPGYAPYIVNRQGNSLIESKKVQAQATASPPQLPEVASTHASVYVKSRELFLPLLSQLRSLQLRAESILEYYLQDYQQQERFFLFFGGGICLALLLFSGVILFVTFYAFILRKTPEMGILKAYGTSGWLINWIFALEATIISVTGILLGVVVGMLGGKQISRYITQELEMANGNWFLLPEIYLLYFLVGGVVFGLVITFISVSMATKADADLVIRAG